MNKDSRNLIIGLFIGSILVITLLPTAIAFFKGEPIWTPDGEDDGVISASNWQISFKDEIDSANAVTPTLCRVKFPDGSIETAQTLAAGYARFEGREVTEGMQLTVEGDSSTNYYSRVKTFSVPNIRPHDSGDYPIVLTMPLWGMDAASDAGVVTVLSGQNLLYNGTGIEDAFAVEASTEYSLNIQFDWNAADDEYFGVEQYTQLAGDKYEFIPVIKVVTSAGCTVESMMQGEVKLTERFNGAQGTSVVAIYQIIPMIEDDGITGDQLYTFSFKFTPDDATGDTLDITFHDETRFLRAESGYTSQAAVETIAQITTS